LSAVIELESYKAREVVFKIGTFGDKFYIILKGSVCVLVRKLNRIKQSGVHKH